MTITGYAKLIADWKRLLVRVIDHEAELPLTASLKPELEAHLEELKAVKERQQQLYAAWREASRDLWHWMAAGRQVASRLRSLVKAEWGLSDPRLVEFGIKPIQKRGPRRFWGLRKAAPEAKPNGSEPAG